MLKVFKIVLLIAILNGGIAHGFFAPLTSLLFGDENMMMPGVEDLLINKDQVNTLPYDFENTIGGSGLGAQISRRLSNLAGDMSDSAMQRQSLLNSLETPLMLASKSLRPAFLEKEKETDQDRMTQMSQDETTTTNNENNNEMKPVDNEELLKDFEEAHKQLDRIKDKMIRTFDAVKQGRPMEGEETMQKSENMITLKNLAQQGRKLSLDEDNKENVGGKNGLWMLRKRKEKIIPLFSMRINTMDKTDPMGLMDKLMSAVTMGNEEPLTNMQMMTAVQQPMPTDAASSQAMQTDANANMMRMQMPSMMPPMMPPMMPQMMGDMQMQMPTMQMQMPTMQMQMPTMQGPMQNMQMQMPTMQGPMPGMQMQMPTMQGPMQNMPSSTDMNTMQLHTIGGLSCDSIHSKSDMGGNKQNKIRLQHGMMSRITYRYESSTCTCGKMMTQSQMCSHAYSRFDEQMCAEREITSEQPKSNCDALEMCKQNANCDGIHFNGAKYTMLECTQKNKQVATKPGLAAEYVIQLSNCF